MSEHNPSELVRSTPVWVFVLVFGGLGLVLLCPCVCLFVYLWRKGRCTWLRNRLCCRWLSHRCGWLSLFCCDSPHAHWDCQEKLCRIQEEANLQRGRTTGWEISPLTSCPICLERFCENTAAGFTVGELRATVQLACGHKFDVLCLQRLTQFAGPGLFKDFLDPTSDASIYSTASGSAPFITTTSTSASLRDRRDFPGSMLANTRNGSTRYTPGLCPVCGKPMAPAGLPTTNPGNGNGNNNNNTHASIEITEPTDNPLEKPSQEAAKAPFIYVSDAEFRLHRLKAMYPWLIRAADVRHWKASLGMAQAPSQQGGESSAAPVDPWVLKTGVCRRLCIASEFFCCHGN